MFSPSDHCEAEIFCKLMVLWVSVENQGLSQSFKMHYLFLGFRKHLYSTKRKCLLLLGNAYQRCVESENLI